MVAWRHTAVRIDDDPDRMRARTGADREPRVVRDGCPGPDDDRVGERPQPVQMFAVLLAGDVVGVPRTARDESVQTLPQLPEGEPWTGQAQRQIALGEEVRLGRGVTPAALSSGVREQPCRVGVGRGAYAEEQLPCGGGIHMAHSALALALAQRKSSDVSSE